jgi:hypothetical protein
VASGHDGGRHADAQGHQKLKEPTSDESRDVVTYLLNCRKCIFSVFFFSGFRCRVADDAFVPFLTLVVPKKALLQEGLPAQRSNNRRDTQSVVCRPRTVAREKKNDAKYAASTDDAMPPASDHHNDKKPRAR